MKARGMMTCGMVLASSSILMVMCTKVDGREIRYLSWMGNDFFSVPLVITDTEV